MGAVAQEITVTGNASLVTTNSATLGQLVDQKQVAELPLNGRYAQQLVFLVPGAENATANYCAANCEGGVFPSEQYAKVNGAGANGVSYQVDGADFNDTYINTNLPFPNPDAIQEFNLVTNNMSAVYGNALGGVVDSSFIFANTKSTSSPANDSFLEPNGRNVASGPTGYCVQHTWVTTGTDCMEQVTRRAVCCS